MGGRAWGKPPIGCYDTHLSRETFRRIPSLLVAPSSYLEEWTAILKNAFQKLGVPARVVVVPEHWERRFHALDALRMNIRNSEPVAKIMLAATSVFAHSVMCARDADFAMRR